MVIAVRLVSVVFLAVIGSIRVLGVVIGSVVRSTAGLSLIIAVMAVTHVFGVSVVVVTVGVMPFFAMMVIVVLVMSPMGLVQVPSLLNGMPVTGRKIEGKGREENRGNEKLHFADDWNVGGSYPDGSLPQPSNLRLLKAKATRNRHSVLPFHRP